MTENFEAIQEENEQELSGEAVAEEPEETASAGEAEEEFSEETEDTEGEAEADGDEASYDADEAEDASEQPEEDAKLMVELLLKQQFGTFIPAGEVPQEMTDSALTEVGNIVLSSFLNAINMLLGTQYQISVPGVAHDMLSSILDVVASIYGQMGETALLVNTELKVEGLEEGHKISGHIILIPDPDSLALLLRKLKVV